jgi:hypothetical protein
MEGRVQHSPTILISQVFLRMLHLLIGRGCNIFYFRTFQQGDMTRLLDTHIIIVETLILLFSGFSNFLQEDQI